MSDAVAPAASVPPPPDPALHGEGAPSTSRARHTDAVRPMPGPRPWPIVGNIPAIKKAGGMIKFMEQTWREHGDVFAVNAGSRRMIAVAHPDGLERVLASNRQNYVKGASYDGVRRIIGNGLLALEGQHWRNRRTLMQPSFHRGALAGMAETMVDVTARWFDDLKRRVPVEGEIDGHREMVRLTLDVVVAALFGRDLGNAGKVSYEALGAAIELLSEVANGIVLPDWIPTPGNRKLKRTMNELEGAVYRVIAAGRQRTEPDGTLLSMLLDSRDAETGAPLSDREVRDEVFTLFVAGHETTALTLTWMFTLLDQEPDVVARLRAEADAVLGGRDPGFADFPKLKFTRQVVDETLRLRGPVAWNARTAADDDAILGFAVKKGDTVMPFFWAVHRHPRYWKDPQRFDPDRFSEENSRGRDPWSYIPFSGGQRICIGNNFSLVESVLIVAMLVQRLDFSLVPGQVIEPNVVATVRPSGPVRVRLRWR